MFSQRRILYVLVAVVALGGLLYAFTPQTTLPRPKWLTQEYARNAQPESDLEDTVATSAPQTPTVSVTPNEPQASETSIRIPDSCFEQHPDIAPPLTPDQILEVREDLNQRETKARELFKSSNLPQHLVVSALLERNPILRLEKLIKAVATNPNDVTTLWHAFNACTRGSNTDACPVAQWETKLIELDGQNGHVWMQIAHARRDRGDTQAALGAIQRAGVAAEYQNFDKSTAQRFQDAYATTGLFSDYELYSLSIGQGRAQYVRSRKQLEDMCVEEAQESIEWAEACLRYADGVIARDQYLDNTQSAHRIREVALGHFGSAEEAEADHDAFKTRVTQMEERLKASSEKLEGLVLANPQLINQLLQNLTEHGELEGLGRSYAQLMKYLPPEDRPECQPPTDSGVDYPPLSLPD